MITKFYDLGTRPPRGGFNYPVGNEIIMKHSEGDVLDELRKYRKNNGTYVSDDELLREMWAYWCQREPTRCGMLPHEAEEHAKRNLAPRPVTKELQGPPIWAFLNTLAVQWNDGLHPYFLATCNAILAMMECPDCRREWSQILRETPPTVVKTRLAACQWVNGVHNTVNRRRGVSEYPYDRMVREWGAPAS